MASSLSNLVNNYAEGIHKIKCKYQHDDKKCETCGIKYKDCECCLEYTNVNNNLIEYKCLCCNKNYQNAFDENFKMSLYLSTSGICLLKYMGLILLIFFSATGLTWQVALKESKVKLDLLTNINMLLVVKDDIR